MMTLNAVSAYSGYAGEKGYSPSTRRSEATEVKTNVESEVKSDVQPGQDRVSYLQVQGLDQNANGWLDQIDGSNASEPKNTVNGAWGYDASGKEVHSPQNQGQNIQLVA